MRVKLPKDRLASFAFVLVFLLTGCAIGRPDASDYKRVYSYAIPQNTSTSLGKAFASDIKTHQNQSGFSLLNTGVQSLEARLALLRAAEKSIDLQYYTMSDDITSNFIFEGILRAAARGVRVRFLVDGVSMNQIGHELALFDKNKNVEIRVFNPLTVTDQGLAVIPGLFADLGQIDKRMHNKVFIVDNQASIIGGRNLGDEYFDQNAESSFKDMDILSVGPITAKISQSFDSYWNSDQSFPIDLVKRVPVSAKALAELKMKLRDNWEEHDRQDKRKNQRVRKLADQLVDNEVNFIWAPASIAADEADKVDQEKEDVDSKPLERIVGLANKAKKEFLVVSPYFVPRDSGIAWLKGLRQKGVDVKVLTNSLSSTDVVAAQTGYKRYRDDLLKNGIDLYELKRLGSQPTRQRVFATTAPPFASLHAKVYIIDRKDIVIGSFNFDPRSIERNTEMALVIHNPRLAAQLVQMFAESTSLKNSYHLVEDNGRLAWITEEKNKKVKYHTDPEASIWRRMQAFLMSLLPIENKL